MGTNPMKQLYQRLSHAGFSRSFVKDTALPSWWDDEAATSPAGYAEGIMLLARHLGLDLSTMRDQLATIQFAAPPVVKLKKTKSTNGSDLDVARTLVVQVAKLASLGVEGNKAQIKTNAAKIREHILSSQVPWVGFESLIDYCWSVGIPVIHVSSFPKNTKRMHGLAAKVNGRSIIVICKEQKSPAWLLFILAHELGHIALGHVEDNQIIVDEEVDKESIDAEESQANAFAIELLTGHPKMRFVAANQWLNGVALATEAKKIGTKNRVDPGHIILNYGHTMNFFAVANAALNHLDPNANGPQMIRDKMTKNLHWSNIPDDAREFVAKMTNASVPDTDQRDAAHSS